MPKKDKKAKKNKKESKKEKIEESEPKGNTDETSAEEKEEKETEESADDPKESEEKSELESELEEQEPIIPSKFQSLLQTKSSAPVLETITQEEPEATLEQEVGFIPTTKEKEPERKYSDTLKYDSGAEYQESVKRQRETNPDIISPGSPAPSVDLQKVGRERSLPGREVSFKSPFEMSETTSAEDYELVSVKKSKKFQRETTTFQENLERRYDHK